MKTVEVSGGSELRLERLRTPHVSDHDGHKDDEQFRHTYERNETLAVRILV